MTNIDNDPARRCIHVIFPCYNEEEGLEQLLHRFQRIIRLQHWDCRLVIINDGSRDHTRFVVQSFLDELPIHYIHFEKNRGVAEVFNTGFAHVLETATGPDDVVVTIDSDNTMNPYLIIDLIERIEDADVVIASRFRSGGGMIGAGYRAWLSHLASWLMRSRVGLIHVTDYSIFFRAYRIDLIRDLYRHFQGRPVAGKGFSCMANLLLRIPAVRPDARFAEVPLLLRYDQKKSPSSIRIFQTIMGYLNLAFGQPKPSSFR
ncbi:MAG: glycosyltransferase family 2 protein [Magnetococcales bacterium]|nr:glycosyltransferase family 2 protein [Magnetococcales bacterium]NGZ04996.1 glycosyltransferase family 2 protein [Magnetococcales bacterium]